MGTGLQKVKPGDPLVIPAATFNTFVDAAQDFLRRQRDIGRTPVADRPPFETVLLKNASGADRGRSAIRKRFTTGGEAMATGRSGGFGPAGNGEKAMRRRPS